MSSEFCFETLCTGEKFAVFVFRSRFGVIYRTIGANTLILMVTMGIPTPLPQAGSGYCREDADALAREKC